MTAINSDLGIITQDWVQKIQFKNKVDLALQEASENESLKIEIDNFSSHFASRLGHDATTSDSYLQSILSASKPSKKPSTECTGDHDCSCYKCQRQKRRAGTGRAGATNNNFYTPLKNISEKETTKNKTYVTYNKTSTSAEKQAQAERTLNQVQLTEDKTSQAADANTNANTITTATATTSNDQKQKAVRRSNTLRKTPTIKSYEKHMPNPVYDHQDSIYRVDRADGQSNSDENSRHNRPRSELLHDDYKISWKEEGTGDDLLPALVTFQTIFEEKKNTDQGLYDLIEQRTKEIKAKNMQKVSEPKKAEDLPPRLDDCLTISYRHGPRHNSLTLYHTMKMPSSKDRLKAYNLAFQHCIHADSGMKNWVKRSRTQPVRENSKLVQPIRRPTIKRTLLYPLSSKRKQSSNDTLIPSSISADNLSLAGISEHSASSSKSKESVDLVSSPTSLGQEEVLTDVILVAHALLPNQQFSANTTAAPTNENKTPYGHIDMPSHPRQTGSVSMENLRDNSSVSSSESANGTTAIKLKKSAPGRLLTTLGRKTSLRAYKFKSSERSKSQESADKVLSDLHRILPHVDRAQLIPYVEQANYDYMTALHLCKAAVVAGELS
ncbi:hypothetical protein A0J61_09379 [Choanephora cucurbitarum]|uniref:Uncharacterized protein n=1 Tax=Choanephora cucurbitarum TaxID=101091 RepID=A0A1C7N0C8_9FUNG|nr:hypothetical protein A0J61_09379 [Choanephora cucurbitarum]